jgi:hypothetical protein
MYRRGLLARVYRTKGSNCTNGPSYLANSAILVGPSIPEIFPVTKDEPAFRLELGPVGRVIATPAYYSGSRRLMFSGNYLETSDSRFSEAARKLNPNHIGPVAIFDRDESMPFDTRSYFAIRCVVTEGVSNYKRLFAASATECSDPEKVMRFVVSGELYEPEWDGCAYVSQDGMTSIEPLVCKPIQVHDFLLLKECGAEVREVTGEALAAWLDEHTVFA